MATMEDVAKKAGVSTATVSHVINETRFVKETTREKVLQAMEELDYHPNFAARSLRRQKTKIIGLLIPDFTNQFYMTVVEGLEYVLRKNGYHLIVSNTNGVLEIEKNELRIFNAQLIDGLIMRPLEEDHSYLKNYIKDYPTIFIDCKPNNYQASDCVLVDNEGGAYEATNLLLKKGHQNVGIIVGSPGLTTSNERLTGYKKALIDNNVKLNPAIIKYGNYRMNSGYKLMKELYDEKNNMTALIVANNAMTMGALKFLKEKKIEIPDEIAIIGFDEREWASLIEPPLTVVKQYPYDMGQKAAELLINRINNDVNNDYNEIRLPTKLVNRDSC